MNSFNVFQKCLVYACLAGAAVCLAVVLAYRFRNQLRELHERWLGLGPLGRVVSILAVTVAVLYGGTKSTTNDPPDTVGGGSTNPPPMMCSSPRPRLSAPPQQTEPDVLSTATPTNYTSLLAWHKRGAYSDWQRIDFPDGFAFPHGTNLLTSVTLFAWGEIRESLVGSSVCSFVGSIDASSTNQLTDQPTNQLSLSLEPGVSSVTYGLTPSNTFLIAWQNACVDRSATNRVDASIELFASGAIAITTQRPGEAPSTNYQAPTPPPGFFGSDQDNAWALAAFPDDYDVITNKGYEAWLMEDKVSINEPNGLYKVSITINQAPSTYPQAPIYLVCGPYKVVVTEPRTYSFPLEVLSDYTARTYPVALPLTIEYDDGYRGEGESSELFFSAPLRNAPRLLGLNPPYIYPIFMPPSVYGAPLSVQLHEAQGALISLWANISGAASWAYRSLSGLTKLRFTAPSVAEIVEARVADTVEIFLTIDNSEYGALLIIEDNPCCSCGCCTGYGCTCGCDCVKHNQPEDPEDEDSDDDPPL